MKFCIFKTSREGWKAAPGSKAEVTGRRKEAENAFEVEVSFVEPENGQLVEEVRHVLAQVAQDTWRHSL